MDKEKDKLWVEGEHMECYGRNENGYFRAGFVSLHVGRSLWAPDPGEGCEGAAGNLSAASQKVSGEIKLSWDVHKNKPILERSSDTSWSQKMKKELLLFLLCLLPLFSLIPTSMIPFRHWKVIAMLCGVLDRNMKVTKHSMLNLQTEKRQGVWESM